jgi:selenocysteine lyase/cysteine desulfurase
VLIQKFNSNKHNQGSVSEIFQVKSAKPRHTHNIIIMTDYDEDDNKNSSLREKAHEEEFERMKREEFAGSNGVTSNGSGSFRGGFLNGDSKDARNMTELRQNVLNDMTFTDRDSPALTKDLLNGDHDDFFCFNSALEWKPNVPLRVPMVYCDFTASHRPLKSIEDYIRQTCLPFYGNTHTNTSVTGGQSSAFVSEARQIIAEVCNAKITGKASQDVVLFAGNGTTGAVRLLIDCLGLNHFSDANTDTTGNTKRGRKPLIVLGPFEHHSNLLPWRELGGNTFVVETARLTRDGSTVDMKDLERILIEHRKNNPDCPFMIGSFSAASNVTGVIVDDIAITKLLHKYGALSFWDYATGASYLSVNMNPNPSSLSSDDKAADIAKDAVFFSGHKLLGGGAGTPGVLIVKKRLVSSLNPPGQACGGGTVFYVTKDRHRFLSDRIERFEGGTPNVVGIWRLGLVWRLKLSLKIAAGKILLANNKPRNENNNDENIKNHRDISSLLLEYELERARNIQEKLKDIPNLVLLDGKFSSSVKKLPIYSFLVRCGNRFLHYNYVCAILNDVFGIQSRGGCQCAGPYSQYLLGMNNNNCSPTGGCGSNEAVEDWLVHTKDELMRPGATRLSLPSMGTTLEQEDYVVEAIRWVAKHGWKLLHVYRCNHRSGEWRHKSRPGSPLGTHDRRWLSHYRMNTLSSKNDSEKMSSISKDVVSSLAHAMNNANEILLLVTKDQSSISQTLKMVEEDESPSSLRWYVYPKVRKGKKNVNKANANKGNCIQLIIECLDN